MKAKDVVKILRVTHQRLAQMVSSGDIKAVRLDNGFYDYDEDSVYMKAGLIDTPRYVITYTRINKKDEKDNLYGIIGDKLLRCVDSKDWNKCKFCYDVDNGIEHFKNLLSEVCSYQVKQVYTNSIRSLYGAENKHIENVYRMLFEMFNCELIVVDDEQKGADMTGVVMSDVELSIEEGLKKIDEQSDEYELLSAIKNIIKIYRK